MSIVKLLKVIKQQTDALSIAEDLIASAKPTSSEKEIIKARKAGEKILKEFEDREEDDAEEDENQAESYYTQKLNPSPELAKIVGNAPNVRTEIVKTLWNYIKKNGLQDKKNKRMINADELLLPLFKKKPQVSMFELAKILNKHLTPIED